MHKHLLRTALILSTLTAACASAPTVEKTQPIKTTHRTSVGLNLGQAPTECALRWLEFETANQNALDSAPLESKVPPLTAPPQCTPEPDEHFVFRLSILMSLVRFNRDHTVTWRDVGTQCEDPVSRMNQQTLMGIDQCVSQDPLHNRVVCEELKAEVSAYISTYEPAPDQPCDAELPHAPYE